MKKFAVLALCLVCFAFYFNALNGEFVFDDWSLIVNNPQVSSEKLLLRSFQSGIIDDSPVSKSPGKASAELKRYRPLLIVSYYLDYKVWGLNPFGFHLTNLLLHLLNVLLVYYLLLLLTADFALSFTVGVIFAVHPVNTSVVSYVSGRADLLVAFFMLVSLVAILKFIKKGHAVYYVLSLLCAALALFCRENAMVLFIFMALILRAANCSRRQYWYLFPVGLLLLL